MGVATSSLVETFLAPEPTSACSRSLVVVLLGISKSVLTFAQFSLHVLGFATQVVGDTLLAASSSRQFSDSDDN